MIFLTVGTTKFPFPRLLKAIDKAMMDFGKKEKLVVQAGTSDYQFRYQNTEVFPEISFDKFISYLKKARLTITHGGPATIFLALKYGKNKPLVMPRRKEFGEHTCNHQVHFVKFLQRKGLVEVGQTIRFIKSPKKLLKKRKIFPSKKLIKKLVEYTESM